MFDPAVGFVFFEFEFGDGFDGVTLDEDFEIGGAEFVEGAGGAGEGAVAFLVEADANGGEGVGKEGVVLEVEFVNGEAGFEGGKLR